MLLPLALILHFAFDDEHTRSCSHSLDLHLASRTGNVIGGGTPLLELCLDLSKFVSELSELISFHCGGIKHGAEHVDSGVLVFQIKDRTGITLNNARLNERCKLA
jgi:hypothetical protein